ncbi:MAG: glycosyltransferase [Verrucomicrobiota bacterium]
MAIAVFIASLTILAAVLGLYPLLLRLCAPFLRQDHPIAPTNAPDRELPTVTCIVAARNAETMIEAKVRNTLDIDYPEDKLNAIFCSDGSTDRTAEILREQTANSPRLHVLESNTHEGKIAALNRAAPQSTADLLLFTDVDARLDPNCLRALARHYADPAIGGVCGRRTIGEETDTLHSAQNRHFRFHAGIQQIESQVSSITANEGKLYTMRRTLYRGIAPGVTDDLYTCLSVAAQGYRFIYEPQAVAHVPLPSRSLSHEIVRRRRIVSTSLRGIWLHRSLLNPFRHGILSAGLFINKILRRLLALFLLLLLISTCLLADHPLFLALLVGQAVFYASIPTHLLCLRLHLHPPIIGKALSTITYFCIGAFGSLLGFLDFLRGKTIDRWDPVKNSPFPADSAISSDSPTPKESRP